MLIFNDVLTKFKECKRLVNEQPEDEIPYYGPSIETMRAVLEQPSIPVDILEAIDKHADHLIKRLNEELTPAAISKMINSLPRFSDAFPSD